MSKTALLDQPAEPFAAPATATSAMVPLDDIVEREHYTRAVRADHVGHLVDSIATVGLEQPLVLITGNQLVAGRHRYHALCLLREQNPAGFERQFPGSLVPARVFDLGEHPDPSAVLALELTENNARADYSDAEVTATIEQLKASGYTCRRGRPGKDDKPIGPVLMRLFGMSEPTMRRALRVATQGEKVSCDRITAPRAAPPSPKRSDESGSNEASDERVAITPVSVEQPAVVSRLDTVRHHVEQFTEKEFDDFVLWFTAHHRQRLG